MTKGELLKKYGIITLRKDLEDEADVEFEKCVKIIAGDFKEMNDKKENRGLKTEKVKQMLKERNMTYREFAEKVLVTEVAMSRFLSGDRVPLATQLVNMTKVLECDIEDIYVF
jgi:DNA-binding Xre family transcriptional regulator